MSEPGCEANDERTDQYGDTCTDYATYPSWCGNYDTEDFVSGDLCCACMA